MINNRANTISLTYHIGVMTALAGYLLIKESKVVFGSVLITTGIAIIINEMHKRNQNQRINQQNLVNDRQNDNVQMQNDFQNLLNIQQIQNNLEITTPAA